LVVNRPVQQMREATFLQKIGCDVRLRGARSHPTGGSYTYMFRNDVDTFLDDATLVVLPHAAQYLGVSPAVTEHIIATLFDLLDDVRIFVAHRRIQQDRGRQLELVENLEEPPVADTIAVVAPGVVARGLRTRAVMRIDALPSLK